MSRIYSVFALGFIGLTFTLGTCWAEDPPPAKLPLLPPPDKAPEAPPVTLVPIELRVAVDDLEKQLLRSFIQKVDPKAEPVLPFVVKGNEKEFALGAQAEPPKEPKPLPEPGKEAKENGQEMPPRTQLIPRPPGARPRLDRLAARPLVAGMVKQILGTFDLAYRIELRSFKLSISGNVLTCEVGGGFHCEGKAVPQGPMLPPPDVRDVGIKMTVTKNLVWSESGKLELKEGTSKVWIDPEAPLIGFPRLDIERVIVLNGVIALMSGTIDRELMKRLSTENLPDLAVIAPTLKEKMPLLAVAELTAYPIRGDDKHVYLSFDVGLVSARKKTTDAIKITAKPGPAPEPKVRGKLTYDKDGKLEMKLDPVK
ncbi:MAG TPA: hypothetical protein VG097_17040 [Gemmata sp.]|jgi:hypothetical protein|nr:hypothetical protein [Gemmata sp.]